MDIVSKLPFTLCINNIEHIGFSKKESDIYSVDFPSFSIFENDEVSILFNSNDTEAKLFLDALDILPDGYGVMLDDEGRAYRQISPEPIPLYKHGNEFDALRVDSFRIIVECKGEQYYSMLDVQPKQLDLNEWKMMRDDLEGEIVGLAQDIVRRNIGIGNNKEGTIPPEKIYSFFVIKKYASKILSALIELQDSPQYHIVTDYVIKEDSQATRIDAVTVRKYLKHGGTDSHYEVPEKRITFDIQENRLLKRIITIYDQELSQFKAIIKNIIASNRSCNSREHRQYISLYAQGLYEFLETAEKLSRITRVIKTQEWYKTVSNLSDGNVPHSFALDSRYGVLYKMYEELRHAKFNVQLDPNYSYSWKKSSSLYEMWCYIKICRYFSECYAIEGSFWNLSFGEKMLFPYLDNGVKMTFSNDKVQIEVIFDQFVPTSRSKVAMHEHPFYTVGKHKRPDITIDIYDKEEGWYIGTIIIECKYRKLSSFWYSYNEWSSKPQIQAYYTDNKSDLTYNGIGGYLDARPIQTVIVLTPDLMGNGVNANSINTTIKALRPDETGLLMQAVMDCIENNITARIERSEKIKNWKAKE